MNQEQPPKYQRAEYCTYRDTDFGSVTILQHQFERRRRGNFRGKLQK